MKAIRGARALTPRPRPAALGLFWLGWLGLGLCLASCADGGPALGPLEVRPADLKLDPAFDNPNDPADAAEPARDYTLFEADPVRPVAVLEQSGLIAVANGVDDYLELIERKPAGQLKACGGTRVGLRPVAVAVVSEAETSAELWVVNHISDSVSVISVDTEHCRARLIDTLYVGDEPRDIVVAAGKEGKPSVFVAAAHRGQHHPLESARSGQDLVTPAGVKTQGGLGDVFVFDAQTRTLREVVNLFTEAPRALAVGDGVVYAAGFHTGNQTTAIMAETALSRGLGSLEPLLLAQEGHFVERDGELVLGPGVAGTARIVGGMPAVVGRGRCLPDPRDDLADRSVAQVCVQTDARQRVERVLVERPGQVHAQCQCTSGDGTLQPTVGVIAQFFSSEAQCGEDLTTFPDGRRGCWLDATPGGVRSPAAHADRQPAPMAWNDEVRFALPDRDVFAIGVDSLRVERSVSGVGTIVYGLAVQPASGLLFAASTEAKNLSRFEGEGRAASTSVRGHLHESQITVIEGTRALPVHLNDHIDYGVCCERDALENSRSLALPTSAAFSRDGKQLYFTALGSDKLAIVRASALGANFHNVEARSRGWLRDVRIGKSEDEPAGPVGVAVDPRRGTLYVKTHFSNELVAVDPDRGEVTARVELHSPEPASITRGRPILYDARRTSSHGDSSCASCHVFGNFDGLAWDLGDPDGSTVKNPGPFAQAPAIFALTGISADPFQTSTVGRSIDEDFRSNKGPMTTQTLRGLANHGALHWRGDRTRRFVELTGAHPNFGSLNEDNSFGEFDVAIGGLNGSDELLPAKVFQDFSNFALQLTLPPNPVRALDDSLTPAQQRARATYFGCASMSDEQFEAQQCVAQDGALVEIAPETHACTCNRNPVLAILRDLPRATALLSQLGPVFLDGEARAALVQAASSVLDPAPERQTELGLLAAELDSSLEGLGRADLALDARSLLADRALRAILRLDASLRAISAFSGGAEVQSPLLEVLARAVLEAQPRPLGHSVAELEAGFALAFEAARINAAVLADDAAQGTSAHRDLLAGCQVSPQSACRLRVFDTLATCNACHTLDPRGNAQFDVYRPGFFGTSGLYSFENESQTFKVPHLRNAYAKAGMFGMSTNFLFVSSSVLGDRRGGFLTPAQAFFGEQVRGFGFLHDGTVDTTHHFLGTTPFAVRPAGSTSPRDPGTATAFQAFLPSPETRAACVTEFRQVSDLALAALPAALQPALALCRAATPVPDLCFLEPTAPACGAALDAIGRALGDAKFAAKFLQVRPLCFQLGSMLEGGAEGGSCYPEGLRERAEMESFVLAFDSNLKPMVGQQVTLLGGLQPALLSVMLRASERGDCDIALWQGERGYLMTRPDSKQPADSAVLDRWGRAGSLRQLERSAEPVTLTCHPPQLGRAEARRFAFSR